MWDKKFFMADSVFIKAIFIKIKRKKNDASLEFKRNINERVNTAV